MAYALVQNGIVQSKFDTLPGVFANITGFNFVSDAEALTYGFFPIVGSPPSYDPTTQSISGPTYQVGATNVTAVYTVTPLTAAQLAAMLASAQSAALQRLQMIKSALLASMPYTFNGTTYQVTLGTQDQIDIQTRIQMLTAAPAGTTVVWEIVNNVFVTMALADLQAMYAAGLAYINNVYTNVAALVAQINAATTVAAVNAVNLNVGWP